MPTALPAHGQLDPYVAVVGPAQATAGEYGSARRVGALLARRGAVVLCGGHDGVMEGAARGAREEGGLVVGILPGQDRSAGNAYLSLALATGLGELRNGLLVRASDAVVAVGGSWGTLSEVALAVRIGKPTVVLDGWEIAGVSTPPPQAGPMRVSSAAEAVETALRAAGRGKSG